MVDAALRRLVLWDIDGTLVHGGGTGTATFLTALEAVTGRRPEAMVAMSGRTDQQIVAQYLEAMELTEGHAEVLRQLELALAASTEQLTTLGRALIGAEVILQQLAWCPDVVSSVLTGNIKANAELKLAAFGLDRWLDLSVGAYGDDDADRRRLVGVSRARVAEHYQVLVDPACIWIVGDTPLDLDCARHSGARCLLVATGTYAVEELAGLGADLVVPDLTATETILEALLS